ncbi:MAG: YabP/YqfC family sporulation protein [Bacilli bacterium]|nr:YabP/YqfC family sporulation protein [Bacilli bacterium]
MFFYDFKTFKIGNYSKILNFDDKKMVILLKNNNTVELIGSELFISFYDKEEIIIEGKIKDIKINYENV